MAEKELAILLTAKNLASSALKRVAGDVKHLDSVSSRASKGMKTLGTNVLTLGIAAGAAGAGLIAKSVVAASDLNETISKTGVVFGQASESVMAWGKNSAAAIGLSQNAALTAASTYGNLFVSMGLTGVKAAGMSTKLVDLAGDLASFNNMDPTEVTEKLRAGLTGESEPLKSLGININETIIKAKALEMGLVKTTASTADLKLKTVAMNVAHKEAAAAVKKYGANSTQALKATVKAEKAQEALEKTTKKIPGTLDAATKAQAAYALIFEQSTTAQGDFARTSDGLANQQRILKANFENTAATLGSALLPKIAEVAKKINELVVSRQPDIERLAGKLPAVFDRLMNLVTAIPWGSVESAMGVMGMGADALLTAFTSMPPWVQTAVLTGWGLNKLTGGALGGIVGELGKGLIKGVLGMNAGVVNINAGIVNGGGLPGVAGGAAAGAAGIGAAALSGAAILGAAAGVSYFATSDLLSKTTLAERRKNGGLRALQYQGSDAAMTGSMVGNLGRKPMPVRVVSGSPISQFGNRQDNAAREAISQRAIAAGFHPDASAIQATFERNAARADRNAMLIRDAILTAAPTVNVNVSAADISSRTANRSRVVKPNGSRGSTYMGTGNI